MTKYQVLEMIADGSWLEVGEVIAASSSTAAVRAHVDRANPPQPGKLRAVPIRSWGEPIVVHVEQRTVATFETANPKPNPKTTKKG